MATGWISRLNGINAMGRRLSGETIARLFLVLLALGLPLAILAAGRTSPALAVRAVMPEKGGWLPDTLRANVGVPLMLKLTSNDVVHGFAVGQTGWPAVDVKPGQVTEVTLTFEEPGTYTYYCTRWCGPNHWRMRGTIEVAGDGERETVVAEPPLYLALGLDIDAPHPAGTVPNRPPAAERAAGLATAVPAHYFDREIYLTQPPVAAWQSLRTEPALTGYTDDQLYDVVALIWRSQATDDQRQLGQTLYGQNCAACHGEGGSANGVFAPVYDQVTDFTDVENMLGANTALLDGKIRRGGMGTGMPYWGTIFTDDEIEALIAYLWRFQFPEQESGE